MCQPTRFERSEMKTNFRNPSQQRIASALLLACASLTGCAGEVWTSYTPHSSTIPRNQVAYFAVNAYDGDIPTLVQAGGISHGTIEASGNQYADLGDLRHQIQWDAAEQGATHVIKAKAGYDYSQVMISAGRATTTVVGNSAYTRYQPPTYATISYPEGVFITLRVEPKDWEKLPPQLRPLPPRKN